MKARCKFKLCQVLCLYALLVAGLMLLSACSPTTGLPGAVKSGPRAWLDQPPDGSTLPLGRFTLKAHANAEGIVVSAIRFSVNGITLAKVPTQIVSGLGYAEFEWNPSVPGQYIVQAVPIGAGRPQPLPTDSIRPGETMFQPVLIGGSEGEPATARVCVESAAGSGCPQVAGEQATATAPPVVSPVVSPLSEKEIILTKEAFDKSVTVSPEEPFVPQIGVLFGTVKSDLNEDGVGEDPLEGVEVTLSGCDMGRDVTRADGGFAFKVPVGTCYLTVSKPEWDFIGASPGGSAYPVAAIVRANAETQLTILMYNKRLAVERLQKPKLSKEDIDATLRAQQAGVPQIGELVGTVASDLNGDGNATGPGEGPLAGVQVTLGQCGTGQVVTGADGGFGFKAPAGNCQLQVYLPGWDFIGASSSGVVYPVPATVRNQAITQVTIFMYNKKAAIDLTPRVVPKPEATYTPTPTTPAKQPPPPPPPDINFWADATQLNAGQCTQLHWNVNNVRAVYLNYGGKQSGVAGQGSQQVCPQGNGEAYQLIVILTDGTQKVAEIWIGITNPKEAPTPTAPAKKQPLPTPTTPAKKQPLPTPTTPAKK